MSSLTIYAIREYHQGEPVIASDKTYQTLEEAKADCLLGQEPVRLQLNDVRLLGRYDSSDTYTIAHEQPSLFVETKSS